MSCAITVRSSALARSMVDPAEAAEVDALEQLAVDAELQVLVARVDLGRLRDGRARGRRTGAPARRRRPASRAEADTSRGASCVRLLRAEERCGRATDVALGAACDARRAWRPSSSIASGEPGGLGRSAGRRRSWPAPAPPRRAGRRRTAPCRSTCDGVLQVDRPGDRLGDHQLDVVEPARSGGSKSSTSRRAARTLGTDRSVISRMRSARSSAAAVAPVIVRGVSTTV